MREYQLMKKAIAKFELDLSGQVVLTEAATNAFLWTPLIAAAAGAEKVYALTRDSGFAAAADVAEQTMRHARAIGVDGPIEIVTEKKPEILGAATIVTNLGFVRPMDRRFIEQLNKDAVICLMWEPWEFRAEDIDLKACMEFGIPILGTNEQDYRLQTFRYVALTVVNLLLDNDIEILDTDIVLLGGGKFFEETRNMLQSMGARVSRRLDPQAAPDCIVCLEHGDNTCLIGEEGLVNMAMTPRPPLVIHVCGNLDMSHLRSTEARVVPEDPAICGSMSFTTGYVGPKPVIDLHCAGLKVGQAWHERDANTLIDLALSLPEYPASGVPVCSSTA